MHSGLKLIRNLNSTNELTAWNFINLNIIIIQKIMLWLMISIIELKSKNNNNQTIIMSKQNCPFFKNFIYLRLIASKHGMIQTAPKRRGKNNRYLRVSDFTHFPWTLTLTLYPLSLRYVDARNGLSLFNARWLLCFSSSRRGYGAPNSIVP